MAHRKLLYAIPEGGLTHASIHIVVIRLLRGTVVLVRAGSVAVQTVKHQSKRTLQPAAAFVVCSRTILKRRTVGALLKHHVVCAVTAQRGNVAEHDDRITIDPGRFRPLRTR